MNQADASHKTTLRIPGNWSNPGELLDRIPTGFRLTSEALILPDGMEIELNPLPPDDQFPQIFRSSCRHPPMADEIRIVDNYTVNIGLTGPGGSMEAAQMMMQAAAAILRAGAGGVFIDNSAVAHGRSAWIEMADDGGPDALSFAFIGIVSGQHDVWTMGMNVPGLPDIVMRRADVEADGEAIIDLIRYMFKSDVPIDNGHVVADEAGPRYRAESASDDEFADSSPMHNPFGRLRLVSVRDIAERN
jgi:hypothetical protein